jgi:hypothetical protein
MAVTRNAYVRRGEVRVEDLRVRKDEVTHAQLDELDKALTAWEASRRAGQRRQSPAPAARGWHRQWQPKQRQPLWLLLAKAELSKAIEDGLAKRENLDATGWEEQRLDGDKPQPTPLW